MQIDKILGVCEPCADRVVERDLAQLLTHQPTPQQAALRRRGSRRAAPRDVAVEEVEWLVGYVCDTEIARRLGCPSVGALQVRLRRAGRVDRAAALTASRVRAPS